MGNKLIDGNITIEDKASRGLTAIEQQLVEVAKKGNSATDAIERLNKSLENFNKRNKNRPQRLELDAAKRKFEKQNVQRVPDLTLAKRNFSAQNYADYARSPMRGNRFVIMAPDKNGNLRPSDAPTLRQSIYNYEAGEYRTGRYVPKAASSFDLSSRRSPVSRSLESIPGERYVSLQDMVGFNQKLVNRAPRGLDALSKEDVKLLGKRFKELDANVGKLNKYITKASGGSGGGGGIKPPIRGGGLFGGFFGNGGGGRLPGGDGGGGKFLTGIFRGLFDDLLGVGGGGKFASAIKGALGGRFTGAMLGGGGAKLFGTIAGGGAAAGPIGIAIGIAAAGIMAGLTKIVDAVHGVIDTINRIASERAREAVGLRRKMQMSSEMFGVDPEDIKSIDKKIYAMREEEQQMYLHGLPGRDITSSAIDWLHLMGTKDTAGGVFENEKEAFEFSKAIAAIAKMNDLSPQEYETVRYQGMQIMSKGYADILDIKPLLNSAPGFVRDLLQQTGMTRKDLLESSRSRGFTSDMFKQALLNVADYYETLADRATSRTTEQQQEAAENIVGRAAIYDELYEKEKAKSNMVVANATVEASIAERMKESWYAMWSDTNDAQDGIVKKVEFEKKLTGMIFKGLNGIVLGVTVVKNIFDMVFNTIRLIGEELIAVINLVPSTLKGAFGGFFAWVFRQVGSIPGFDEERWNAMADEIDPNAKKKLNEAYLESRADEINKYISKLDPNTDLATLTSELAKMGIGREEVVGYEDKEVIPKTLEQRVWDDNLLGGGRGGWREPLPYDPALKRQKVWVERPELAYTEKVPIKQNVLPEEFVKEFFFGGGNADESRTRIADESFRKNVLMQHPELWAQLRDGIWQDKEAFEDLEGQTRSLSAVLGGVAKSGDDYTWGNRILKSFTDPIKNWVTGNAQDLQDVKRAREHYDKANREYQEAIENVHGGYIPKIAGDVNKLAGGKGNEKILDVLKEIAGVVVINKVTQVRPDVVFNYGSYGRNGPREQENVIRTGDGNVLASIVEALQSVSGKWDDNFQSITNGVSSEYSIA